MTDEQKPRRLYFKTYLKMIHNSIGTGMFRNWYVQTPERGEFDAMKDGEDSCAFYVSSLLKIYDKVAGIHGTVDGTVKDLESSGWQVVGEAKEGDVLVWEAQQFGGKQQRHIGFYVGNGKAVSASYTKKVVVEHEQTFGDQNRKVEQIFRMNKWDEDNA
jgi:hypothetical protein